MFWDVLKESADILTYWRFWAVTLSYGALGLIPMLAGAVLVDRAPGLSFAVMIVSGIVWPVIILTGAILLLAPLLLARVNTISWDFLVQFSILQIALIGGIGLIASVLIAIVPILGSFRSIGAFVQVSVMIGFVASILSQGTAMIWPGWLMGLGLAVTGGIVAYLLAMVLIMLVMAILRDDQQDFGLFIAKPATALVSMIPACLYAGWLRVANGI